MCRLSLGLIRRCLFEYQSHCEIEDLVCFVASRFSELERAHTGLAELLINAIEHGNLAVGYAGKSDLITKGM